MLPLVALLIALPCILAHPSCSLTPPKALSSTLDPVGGLNQSGSTVAQAWYPGWLATGSPSVNWTNYNTITYAFAVTTPDVNVLDLTASNEPMLSQFVEMAHENDVKAIVSIGGWTGSRFFSSAVATAANRTAFVKTVVGLVNKYHLDGVDFDWESPAKQGVGCNTISPQDSANFLSFLQELRTDPVGKGIKISAAVGIVPFMDSTGSPMTDVSDFAKVFDYIEIMNYDVWGSWSTGVGPNAPLNDTCAPSQQGSAASAVKAWTTANFPPDRIVLGVAAYGHSFHVDKSVALSSTGQITAYPAFNASEQPHGDSQDSSAGLDECGNPTPIGGIFNFWGLVAGGFLNTNGTAASGIDYMFDNCSQTPYVYNPTSEVMISYDDAASFAAKGKFINEAELLGFSLWHALGDYGNILTDAISEGMGIESSNC